MLKNARMAHGQGRGPSTVNIARKRYAIYEEGSVMSTLHGFRKQKCRHFALKAMIASVPGRPPDGASIDGARKTKKTRRGSKRIMEILQAHIVLWSRHREWSPKSAGALSDIPVKRDTRGRRRAAAPP